MDLWGILWDTSMGTALASWEHLYCYITQKKASQECLYTALLSTKTTWPLFGLIIYLFFILRGTWGGRVFDLATFICQSVAHNSVLKRGWEVLDGSFNRSLTPRNHKQKKHLRCKMESKGTTYETVNKTGVKSIPLETLLTIMKPFNSQELVVLLQGLRQIILHLI